MGSSLIVSGPYAILRSRPSGSNPKVDVGRRFWGHSHEVADVDQVGRRGAGPHVGEPTSMYGAAEVLTSEATGPRPQLFGFLAPFRVGTAP